MQAQAEELSPRKRQARVVLHRAAEKLALHERVRAETAVSLPGSSLVSDALDRIEEALRRCGDSRHPAASTAQEVPPLFRKPAPTTTEEARARLQEILDLRIKTRIPSPGEVYTIPPDQLRFKGLFKVVGPSLINGDYPVEFDYYVRGRGKKRRPLYGPGAKTKRDMQFVSDALYTKMYRCLRLLPGYTKTCERRGGTLRQPLKPICNLLLRGKITVDQVRFRRLSPKGQAEVERERALSGQAPEPPSQTSLTQLAMSLLRKGRSPAATAKALRARGAAKSEVLSALRSAQQQLESR